MTTLHRKPLKRGLFSTLGGGLMLLALSLAFGGQALAQTTVTIDGSGSAAVSLDEGTLGEIGDYSATAADGSAVTYALSGADADDFHVSNIDGDAGTVYNNRAFDFEDSADKTLEFTVTATAGGATATKDVTVTVGDVNDRPAFSADVLQCSLREDSLAGESCGASPNVATDDDGDSLTYSLSDANPQARYLSIDPSTGEVTLSAAGAGRLDYEARPEFTVQVRVSDNKDAEGNADDEIDDRAVIRVIVEDLLFEAPSLSSVNLTNPYETMRVVWSTTLAQAQNYKVQYRAVGDSAWTDLDLAAAGALQQGFPGRVHSEIGGLYPGTEYEIQWCTGTGCTPSVAGANTLTTEARPNAPAEIGYVSDLAVAENSVAGSLVGLLYGHSGGSDQVRDTLRFWLEGPGSDNFAVTVDGNGTDAWITTTAELDHETAASYTLMLHVSDDRSATGAADDATDDSRQVTITVTDVLERPDSPILTAATVGTDSVSLTWAAPDAGDQTIIGYRIQYRKVGDSKWGHTRRIDGTTVTIGHLTPGTAYEFRGFVVTDGRPSTWSDRETAPKLAISTTPGSAGQTSEPETAAAQAAEPPAASRNLRASSGGGAVTLTWDAPDDPSITGYQILRKLFGSNAELQVHVADTGSAAATFTDSDVEAGTRYVYRVKAINAAGVGDQSNYVRVTPG